MLKTKKKIGRPRSKNPLVHTAVALPADLVARLKGDGAADGHGLSAEIRTRLQATYLMQGSSNDPETNNLLSAVRHLSDFLARDIGKRWHEHPYAMAAFKAGLNNLLARYHPEGDESVHPDPQVSGDPPDVVGRTHARRIGIAGHEEE